MIAGAAPISAAEVESMIPVNRQSFDLVQTGDRAAVAAHLAPIREALLTGPLAAFAEIMETAPVADLAIIRDPGWSSVFQRSVTESLGQGLDGWIDGTVALDSVWDVDPTRVSTSVTWYHDEGDRNCPFEAARRLVASLPRGRLVEWRNAGHLTAYHLEREILDELIARG